MLLYKSKDGQHITVVIKDREETMTIAQWSDMIARPTARTTPAIVKEAKA